MMLAQKAGMDFDQEYAGAANNNNLDYDRSSGLGLDMASQSHYTSVMGSLRGNKGEKQKKYQARVEIRSSNQEILDFFRNDIENLIVQDLTDGQFIMS